MTRPTAFSFIASTLGALMSGYLSYLNIFGQGCTKTWISCSVNGQRVLLIGQPTCIYGLGMFLVALILTGAAWQTKQKSILNWLIGVGALGTAFSFGLIIYEAFWLQAFKYGFPACVYGFIFFTTILISAITWRKNLHQELLVIKK